MKFFWKSSQIWVPFRYWEFCDFPRFIVLTYQGKWLYFTSPFDDVTDEYPDYYSVYLLPAYDGETSGEDFYALIARPGALIPVGTVPIADVKFDPTRRKQLDASVIHKLLPASALD